MVNQMLSDRKRHATCIDLNLDHANLALMRGPSNARSLRRPMFFILRCLFWLGLVYLALPLSGLDWRADVTDAQQAVQAAAGERVKDWCLKDPATCAKNAAEAADLLGLLPPQKGASQNTLQPGDLKPTWRGHGEAARPSRG
jgi:hypothetical protein